MRKYSILEGIKIEKVGFGGIGIATLDGGKKIIVKGGVLPGSIVDVKVMKVKKDYIQAKALSVKKIEGDYTFREDLCNHYFFSEKKDDKYDKGCGGCKWQILSYPDQLKIKQDIVLDSFRNIKDKLEEIGVGEISPSPIVDNYRNKIEFSFGADREENFWKLGFHKQGKFASIVNVLDCKLVSEKVNEIYAKLREVLEESGLPVYRQKNHEGFFRHLMIREGFNTNQVMVVLSVADNYFEKEKGSEEKWKKLLDTISKDSYFNDKINSFIVSYNSGLADVIKPQDVKTQLIFGEEYIFEKLKFEKQGEELNFRISTFGFFQTNTFGAQNLFGKAVDIAGGKYNTMLDLYCGAGSIGLSFLKLGLAKNLIGIEINEESIYDANYNAKINGLSSEAYFRSGKAEKVIFEDPELQLHLQDIDFVVVDPPREGLHKNVIKFLLDMKKITDYKLLYISCNPVTMADNVKDLMDGGFDLKKLNPIDMFPHTHHIEMIGLLQ